MWNLIKIFKVVSYFKVFSFYSCRMNLFYPQIEMQHFCVISRHKPLHMMIVKKPLTQLSTTTTTTTKKWWVYKFTCICMASITDSGSWISPAKQNQQEWDRILHSFGEHHYLVPQGKLQNTALNLRISYRRHLIPHTSAAWLMASAHKE